MVVLWNLTIALLSAAIVGKSQFMQYAAKLSPRAVMSSGRGSSSAGLTVTAIKDGGQWALEAGALVLADGTFLPFSTSTSSM
jgi:DNA replicative helicase MCM subunit Mcm2 (Cdc46/Mcm family)